jgi:hypothetical protein
LSAASHERPRRQRLYLDTSAYLCILLAEDGSERLSEETGGAELLSSVLLVLETRRNLVRLAREGALTAAQYKSCLDRMSEDKELFALRDLTLDLCESTLVPAVSTPRSLDLAHLRTALWFHAAEPITRFVTMDASQEQAAEELGLPV